METILLLVFIPITIAIIAKVWLKATITWQEFAIQAVACFVIIAVVYGLGRFGQTMDTQLITGEVVDKVRHHDSYVRSYRCNCYTTCSGSGNNRTCTETCSTCYEDRYTVDWYLKTTIGRINIDSLDRSSRSVYNRPDPSAYTNAVIGEACSKTDMYTNYIKAVPESLFSKESAIDDSQFSLPEYPRVHSIYKVNRVIGAGSTKELRDRLDEHMKTIGPNKQANIIFVGTNSPDPSYRYALERKWVGGKKNDLIVVVGLDDKKITWADVITLGGNAGNELTTVKIRDILTGTNYSTKSIDDVADIVTKHFDRKPMADYEYLKDEIEPPTWVLVLAFILGTIVSIGLTYVFHVNDIRNYRRY